MRSRHTRLWILAAFTLFSILLVAFLPHIPQNPAYHDFADQRSFFGIPNCLNVVSNVGGVYIIAKLFELFDRPIFGLGHVVSGHTLKHLIAALSAYWALRMLKLRSPVAGPAAKTELIVT